MLINPSEFANLQVMEELSDRSVDKVAMPTDLVRRAMLHRESAGQGIQSPWSKLSGLFELRSKELVLMGGYSGHGKSAVMSQWGLHAAASGHTVGFISLELPAEYVFDQLAGMSAVASETPEPYLREFAQWMDDRLYIYDRCDLISPNEALQAIIGLRKFFGCDLIVLDCLFMVGLTDDLDAEKKFSQALAQIAKAFDCCIVCVHHMRKPQGRDGESLVPTKHDFIGSSHLVNVASSVVIVWDNKKKAREKAAGEAVDDDHPDTKVVIAKQRYAAFEGVVGLYKHDRARVLCNSRARQYRPINVREDNANAFMESA